jgi:hypothetical protein
MVNISIQIKTCFICHNSDSIHFYLEQSTVAPPPPIRPPTISTNRRATISLVPPSTPTVINDRSISIQPVIIKSITTANAPTTLIYHNGRMHSTSGKSFNSNNKKMNR